jgi:phospholipid-transporting ATPase
MPQFVFSFYNLGSGQSIYLSWAITLYNLAFTFFPVVIRAVFEVDITVEAHKDMLKRDLEDSLHTYYPKMYYIGQKNTIFNGRNFLAWFSLGAVQGIVCLLINLYALNG